MGILHRAIKGRAPWEGALTGFSLGGAGTFNEGPMWSRIGAAFTPAVASSGAAITPARAMQVPAYAAAVRVVAEDVAGVPLILYRRTGEGKVRATDSPQYRMLHDAPNPEMTSMVFRETLQAHVLGWGNAYAEMVRPAGGGPVVELWPLRPDKMQPRRDEATGALFYRYTLPDGNYRDLPRAQVFHLPGLGFDGVTGYPVLTYMAREVLGIAIAQQEYVSRYYANDAAPGIYLRTPNKLSDTAARNLRDSFDASHAGLTNKHRTAILEEGLDIGTVGVSPAEQQLLDARKWSATEVGAMFRLAPWKIGIYDRATWSNVEDGNIDHWQSALRAWFVRWDQQLNLQVVGLTNDLFAEHLVTGILRGNAEARARYYWTMRQAGAMTGNEVREAENLNRLPGGDELMTPTNMVPVGEAAPAPEGQRGTTL